jgi:hypothetical protein
MARHFSLPATIETDASGEPTAFTWRGVRLRVCVIGRWYLRDRRWQHWERQSDRRYYRLLSADHEVFEVYRELTSKGLWVLDVVHD